MRIAHRDRLAWFVCAALGLAAVAGAAPAKPPATRPNFVLILVDDWGWTDAGCYGSDLYQTPHIDRLARGGIRFTDAYAAGPVCSPTRAALLTGKYPARLHLTDWIHGHRRPRARLAVPEWTHFLPLEETTLAEILKESGYVSASIGKWHLGDEERLWPTHQGFDLNIAGSGAGQPPSYFFPYRRNAAINGSIPTLPGGEPGEYLTDRLTAEAVRFIEANRERPFFLYLPHFAVHTPLQAKPALVEKYRARVEPRLRHTNPVYAAMMESVDDSVGRVVAALERLGILDQTVVFVTGDNGGLIGRRDPITVNVPLRAGKGSAYEGGVRVPLIVSCPGTVRAGRVSNEPVTTPDLFSTILELAGVSARRPPQVDGENLAPILFGRTERLGREAIYWHYPHYHPGGATPFGAIRARRYRLVEFDEDAHVELYDLQQDVGEAHDLAARLPELAAELRRRLRQWREAVGAQMARPNPDFDPAHDDWAS